MSTTPSGNHESPKSKILKRKKARSNTPLSCKIQYYIKANSADRSSRSAFFTDDEVGKSSKPRLPGNWDEKIKRQINGVVATRVDLSPSERSR